MKKITLALVAAALAVPALAQEPKVPQGKDVPALEMQRDHEAFKKAQKEHRAQMKATKEKMEKLVKEYNKLKDGKKKDAKRAEIEKEVSAIHEKQLAFKKDQLAKFEERLARMKEGFEKENSVDSKKEWVSQKTDALIKADGNLKALFDRPEIGGPQARNGKGPRMGKGFRRGWFKRGPKGPRPEGPRPQAPLPDFDD